MPGNAETKQSGYITTDVVHDVIMSCLLGDNVDVLHPVPEHVFAGGQHRDRDYQ
jgi:hypothetical protein